MLTSHSLYRELINNCGYLASLEEAIDDVNDLLGIQPENNLAKQLLIQLQDRVKILSPCSNDVTTPIANKQEKMRMPWLEGPVP
ncbi:hypothetical protein KSZ_22410 [Dictyobacter formicarum]|uniref:Uncharacterized protein n=1 Tax=Dictyobacter formicarum TaxID=2778368 RepID=A0ABQ3VE51_9CHLR|nr:hypothetical protein KSZ_22410 [Dictyobacter formicarum]